MNTCIGFPSGINANTYTTQRGPSTTISTTITRNIISITLNQTDLFNFTDRILQIIQEQIEVFKFLQMHYILVQLWQQL